MGPTPAPVVDSATMLAFAGTTETLMQAMLHTVYGGQHLGTPNPFVLPSLTAPQSLTQLLTTSAMDAPSTAATSCVPIQTGLDSLGAALDADGDGVPDDLTVDFGAGCSQLVGGQEFTFSGKYRLQDPGGGLLDFTYTTTALSAMVRDTLSGDFFRQQVTGNESAHFTAGHTAHAMEVTREVTAASGAESTHVSLHTIEASAFDPDGGSTFQLGGTLPQGTFGMSGVLIFRDLTAGTDSTRFTYSTPTSIHLSFACGTGIDAGVLLGLAEGDERVGFRLTRTGCVDPTVELFGTTE